MSDDTERMMRAMAQAARTTGETIDLYPGEFVTCTNGHLICEVIEHIQAGTLSWASKLGHFRGTIPTLGAPLLRCEQCGAEWVYQWPMYYAGELRAMVNHLHIKGRGWVPPRPAEPEA